MKRDKIDKNISLLLKEQMPQAAADGNEWFTRKVLNRLPPKPERNYAWINVAVYVISLAICLAGWVIFIFSLTPGILLVKDLLSGIALFAVTVVLLWHALGHLLRMAET